MTQFYQKHYSLLQRSWIVLLSIFGLTVSASAQYCLPTYDNPCTSDDFINTVQFVTINNSNTGCGSPGVSNYTDYSATLGTTVTSGSTYTLTVQPGISWGQYFVMLIDLNQDGDFDDNGEFFDVGYASAGQTISAPITIPCGAAPGLTRMRVMCQFSSTQLTPADICAVGLTFGEVEDYALTITMPNYVDAGLLGFESPTTDCGLGANMPVTMQIFNCGGDTVFSVQACYSMNGGANVCETINDTILPGDSLIYTFSSTVNMSASGTYTFDGTVILSGDAIPVNDTLNGVAVTNVPIITSFPYSQNFDANNGGYTTEGFNSSWEWGQPNNVFIPAAASAPNAWVTNLDGAHNDNELSYLVSPCFNMSSLTVDPMLSFSHIYELTDFGDGGWVEITTNGGSSWAKLGASGNGNNWYNNPFDEWWDFVSGNTGAWRGANHRLTGAAGNANVRFRFVLLGDPSTALEGMGVDDVRVQDTLWNAGVVGVNNPRNGCTLTSGEQVSVEIANLGTHTLTNFSVCYSLDGGSPVCEVVSTPLASGDTMTYVFTATANVVVLGAHDIVAYTSIPADSVFYNDTLEVDFVNFPIVNAAPYYFENFEGGQGNWVSNGVMNDWAFGTPFKAVISGAASGSNAWVTGTTGFFNYNDDQNSWVESPCFDLTGLTNPWVATKVWWETETGYDGAVLEYSTDGGDNWTQIGSFGDPNFWYNEPGCVALIDLGQVGDAWCGRIGDQTGSGGYVQTSHEIGALAGLPEVRFRMHFATDVSVQYDGIAFDDFAIGELPTVALGNDTIICDPYTLAPNLDPNGVFQWSNNTSNPTITISTNGNYILAYTDSLGFTGRDTIVVTMNVTPAVDLGADRLVCVGTANCLSVDSVAYSTVTWSNGATTGQTCITTSGTWMVTVVDTVGCVSMDTIMTTVVPLPTPNLGPDTTLCQGGSLCLDPQVSSTGHTFVWSNGATTPTICTSILANYWVRVTDLNGCAASDSILVTLGPLTPLALGSADTSGCPVVQFTSQSVGMINSYGWVFGDGGNSTAMSPSHDYSAAGNGSYLVHHIVANECGIDTVSFTVVINCLVNIDGGEAVRFSLWPNPNRGEFRIDATVPGTVASGVEIVNLHGQVVYARDYGVAAGRFTENIALGNAAAGVYFVRFRVGEQVHVEKMVIE